MGAGRSRLSGHSALIGRGSGTGQLGMRTADDNGGNDSTCTGPPSGSNGWAFQEMERMKTEKQYAWENGSERSEPHVPHRGTTPNGHGNSSGVARPGARVPHGESEVPLEVQLQRMWIGQTKDNGGNESK